MPITGATRTYALLGHPVTHSQSPALHNDWFNRHHIDAVYVALDLDPNRPDQVIPAFRTLGLAGANLTVPFKTAVLPQLDRVSEVAKAIGAVNTLYWDQGALCGDNTDAQGFVDSLISAWGSLEGPQSAVILGVGGAGRAVAAGLAQADVREIHLLNRTVLTASAVAAHLGQTHPRTTFRAAALGPEEFRRVSASATLVVNCVSGPGAKSVASLPLSGLCPTAIWADLNYWMPQPPAFKALREQGIRLLDGHPMLRHQAALSFRRWTGIHPIVQNRG